MMVPGAVAFNEGVATVIEAYAANDKAGATDRFCTLVSGPEWRGGCEKFLPEGWLDQAVTDLDGCFQSDLPGLTEWQFSQEVASRINQPALCVVGQDSFPLFKEGNDLLLRWLPRAEQFVVPDSTHGLPMMNPSALAAGLSAFFMRNSVAPQSEVAMKHAF